MTMGEIAEAEGGGQYAENPFGLTEELFERLGYAFCDGWMRRVRDTNRDEELDKLTGGLAEEEG